MLSPIMFSTKTTRKVFSQIIPRNIPIEAGIPKLKAGHSSSNTPIVMRIPKLFLRMTDKLFKPFN